MRVCVGAPYQLLCGCALRCYMCLIGIILLLFLVFTILVGLGSLQWQLSAALHLPPHLHTLLTHL